MSAIALPSSFSYPILRKGDKGSNVKLCQQFLSEVGYRLTPDGDFGKGTLAAVWAFQDERHLGADGVVGRKTWEALISATKAPELPGPLPEVLARMTALGHRVVWQGDHHLNLFGIRDPSRKANSFDDILGCAYTVGGMWRVHYWRGTTDPGASALASPVNKAGTAILVAGQYLDTWQIGSHKGEYEALCQRGTIRVHRDGNKDSVLDLRLETIEAGDAFGINIHHASSAAVTAEVGPWSAGCQVHATIAGFEDMMSLARKQVAERGLTTFSYTLMDQWWTA